MIISVIMVMTVGSADRHQTLKRLLGQGPGLNPDARHLNRNTPVTVDQISLKFHKDPKPNFRV